ncbi:MAG: hypothetical protein BZ136_08580 [Methanosphaera sp. rholeuAM74]|nr:MAG: hypothetical protein BZ136_08580 [Methanosphaera sp. rholeuAM74]
MDNKYKLLFVVLLGLLAVVVVGGGDTSYNVPYVVGYVNIGSDGLVSVEEDVNYTLDDSNTVSRVVSYPDVGNVTVATPGLFNDYNVSSSGNSTNITVVLYTDESKTVRAENTNAKVYYNYTLSHVVTCYDDCSVFDYVLWDSHVNRPVWKFQSYVNLTCDNSLASIYYHPRYMLSSAMWVTPTNLESVFKSMADDGVLEERVVLPSNTFNSTDNVNVVNSRHIDNITVTETNYQSELNSNTVMSYVVLATSIVLVILPVFIFGLPKLNIRRKRESKSYHRIPCPDSPVRVNYLLNIASGGVNINAVMAVILDLIRRGVLIVEDFTLAMHDYNVELDDCEKHIIKFLREIDDNTHPDSTINNNKIITALNTILNKSINTKTYYNDNKSRNLRIYLVITLIYTVVALMLLYTMKFQPPISLWAYRSIFILVVVMVIVYLAQKSPTSQTTSIYDDYYSKWESYKQYISNYTLLKQSLPISNEELEEMILYSMTLDCYNILEHNLGLMDIENTSTLIDLFKSGRLDEVLKKLNLK